MRSLISREAIAKKIAILAKQISEDYAGKSLVILGILNGSFMFVADLVRQITIPLKVDFISLSSYKDDSSVGEVALEFASKLSLRGENVLVVDDIIDSGLTARYLLDCVEEKRPASIKLCVLLDKPSRRASDVKVDYAGFEIRNVFVIGYGMDFNEGFRCLPEIYYREDENDE